jgi:hypothetical protein
VLVLGVLMILLPAAGVSVLAWQNRAILVSIRVGDAVWTVNIYGLLIMGALLACWVFLGAAFIRCRIAERRRARVPVRHHRSEPAGRGVPVS